MITDKQGALLKIKSVFLGFKIIDNVLGFLPLYYQV